jgi:hypothetical protein
MSEPIGTTRRGQVLLGALCLAVGLGSCFGLLLLPAIFEPILRLALIAFGTMLRAHIVYEPSLRAFYAIGIALIGTLGASLFAYAFYREPMRNCAIDAYLTRYDGIENVRRASVNAKDDPQS